jgi:hypothetical protein
MRRRGTEGLWVETRETWRTSAAGFTFTYAGHKPTIEGEEGCSLGK